MAGHALTCPQSGLLPQQQLGALTLGATNAEPGPALVYYFNNIVANLIATFCCVGLSFITIHTIQDCEKAMVTIGCKLIFITWLGQADCICSVFE